MVSRRDVLVGGVSALVGGTVLAGRRELAAQPRPAAHAPAAPAALVTPNGVSLPWRMVAGVKVYHLVAEPVTHTIAPGLEITGWGYNGRIHGPTIEAVEGDRVRFYVTNRLPEPTSVHWHGVVVPNGMDGVVGLTQPVIAPGETFRYELTMRHPGTFMYHPHYDEMTQMALGMTGMLIVHPRVAEGGGGARPQVDRDFALLLHEWAIPPGTRRPNPLAMNDFNVLTINAKAFPGTAPLVVRQGERVRIRIGNLSAMEHHPIHLHGYSFKITATDGGPIPAGAQWPATTVLVPVGCTRDIEFVADNPGDWPLHCHMTHHVMNQMGHDSANMIGVQTGAVDRQVRALVPGYMSMGQAGMGGMGDMGMPMPRNSIPMGGGAGPYGAIDMGGMFTVLKVREHLESYDDPGWYPSPEGTLARTATGAELHADGIDAGPGAPPPDDGNAGGHHHG